MNTFAFAVAQKRAESARIEVIQYGYQEAVVEFKSVGELLRDLPDAVDELEKNWGTISV